MPVYVYRNLVTNETFEHQQGITEDPLTVDPRTGDPVKRVIQPVGIAFKGSGFYVNDSRKSGGASTSKSSDGVGSSGPAASGAATGGASAASSSSTPASSSAAND